MKYALLPVAALAAGLLATPAFAHGGRQGGHEGRFQAMDANGDGKVTRAEAEASAKARFAERDKNGDGKLTGEELPHRAWRMHRHGDDDAKGGTDTSGEPMISQADFVARALSLFDRMDANGDGTVTSEERDQARAKLKEKWREHRGAK